MSGRSTTNGTPPGALPLEQLALRLHVKDDVAIAKEVLQAGTRLAIDGDITNDLTIRSLIPTGHKFALHAIPAGEPVRRYGQLIGFARTFIQQGEHVHIHNLGVKDFTRETVYSAAPEEPAVIPVGERRSFLGYQRADGRVGTRNYIAVIATVNCSAHVCREIAHYFTPEALSDYPNVDGVIALTHPYGCTTRAGSQDYHLLQRTLAGMAQHPNVGGYLLVGLGCESNSAGELAANCDLCGGHIADGCPPPLVIQELGGIRKTVQAGIASIEAMLPAVNTAFRTVQPVSELTLALQCGGSDGWSGVTANPMVGLMADELVRQGGTVTLGETPEVFGAEHLLAGRTVDREVGEKLVEKVKWWQAYTSRTGVDIDFNRSLGNQAGGLSTIFEKSLGAIAKGGSTPLAEVYDYAERVSVRGLTFMDTPGNDPVSVTGQVAGGCTLVVFTTGRGSVFGFKPAPSIKISTNSTLFRCMEDDMDLDAGVILEGRSMAEVAKELFELVIEVASGRPSKSEAQDVGEEEFVPWIMNGVL